MQGLARYCTLLENIISILEVVVLVESQTLTKRFTVIVEVVEKDTENIKMPVHF